MGINRAKWSRPVILTLAGWILAGFSFSGCVGKNTVMINSYTPVLSKDFGALKGQKICFLYFQKDARFEDIYCYYSYYKKTRYYLGRRVSDYFRRAFEDACATAGMIVTNEDKPDLTAPAMRVTPLSIHDERFLIVVTVQKKDMTVFYKSYSVEESRALAKDASPPELAQRAYRMANRLIESVLGDPEFQTVIIQP